MKHPWLTQPSPSPSSLSISSVLGVQGNTNDLVITNQQDINQSCGLTSFENSSNLQTSAQDLAKVAHCETPSTSSSVGSLDEAEIISFAKPADISNTKDDLRSAMDIQAVVTTQPEGHLNVIEEMNNLANANSLSSDVPNERSSEIGRSQTAEQLVEVQDSSEDRYGQMLMKILSKSHSILWRCDSVDCEVYCCRL